MLKKIGLVAVAAAAALTLGSVAYADGESDDGHDTSGGVYQYPEKICDEDILSGKLQIPEDDDSENDSDDDVDCDQDLHPDDD